MLDALKAEEAGRRSERENRGGADHERG